MKKLLMAPPIWVIACACLGWWLNYSENEPSPFGTSVRESDVASEAKLRRPVDLILVDDDRVIVTANHRSGTISCLDANDGTVIAEVEVDGNPSGLFAIPESREWVVTDSTSHTLSRWRLDENRLTKTASIDVASYPMQVVGNPSGSRFYIASRWSRRLSVVDWDESDEDPFHLAEEIDLAFAPHNLSLLHGAQQLFVGDAFGNQIKSFDAETLRENLHVEIPGHNIRGVAATPDEQMIIVSHQMLNELAHTVRNDVHWGLLMSNDLRWISLEALRRDPTNIYQDGHMQPLGQVGNAAGDPAEIAITSDGLVVVALAGVDQVAVGRKDDFRLNRLPVGNRPTAVVIDKEGSRAFVANTFDDSISVVDLVKQAVASHFSLGETAELTLADRGELLFHDARLSHDSWMSCQSCHTDGHTNGMLNDNLSDDSFGAPKRVLSLLGKADTLPLAWDGSKDSFHDQIESSIRQTMQSDTPPQEAHVEAIAAFLETLEPPPALDVARRITDESRVEMGGELFRTLQCVNCHRPPEFTTPDLYDVDLRDEMGRHEFNPPSLRGVSQRGPYFHDNRAPDLEAVVRQFNHRLPRELNEQEIESLLVFLRSI